MNAVLLAPMIACNIEYTKLKKQALYPDYQHKVRTLKSSNIAIAYSLYFASEALGIRRQPSRVRLIFVAYTKSGVVQSI